VPSHSGPGGTFCQPLVLPAKATPARGSESRLTSHQTMGGVYRACPRKVNKMEVIVLVGIRRDGVSAAPHTTPPSGRAAGGRRRCAAAHQRSTCTIPFLKPCKPLMSPKLTARNWRFVRFCKGVTSLTCVPFRSRVWRLVRFCSGSCQYF